jgi:hypothetical protein
MPCLSLGDEEEQALEVAGSEIEKEKVSRSKENGERGITPPSSPTRKSGEKEKEMEKVTPKRSSPKPKTFSPSELSDCPADISEWDVGQAKPEFVSHFPGLSSQTSTRCMEYGLTMIAGYHRKLSTATGRRRAKAETHNKRRRAESQENSEEACVQGAKGERTEACCGAGVGEFDEGGETEV